MAGHLDKYIEPGQRVPTLRIGDKVLLGIRNSATPLAPAGWLLVAGYSQVINSTPNYGTDGKAFAQRLGAAAARGSSESIFADSIMASVLHEDPRYYKMGPQHSFFQRTVYSVTRVLITRTDGGRTTPNLSFLSGNLAAAALTQAYYPAVDRGFRPVLKTYGGAVAGGALTYLGREFFGDARDWFQRRKSK
jgi:hypothetical protein